MLDIKIEEHCVLRSGLTNYRGLLRLSLLVLIRCVSGRVIADPVNLNSLVGDICENFVALTLHDLLNVYFLVLKPAEVV